ncbi:MAG: hypothetical protein OEW58_03510 [Gammaproteobacteria bacterium]|nr:hypothetical protein [Gammaproteobacteria bacterium]
MAIVWSTRSANKKYEVRTAGNSIRLYCNGVFHSQFNPQKPFCGQVWDLLSLPVFFSPLENFQRILLLGVGGGAVIRQLEHVLHAPEIVGVDIDRIHLRVAKKFFAIGDHTQLVHADAQQWLTNYQGAPFDLIIDDLFGDDDGEPSRAIAADRSWMSLLHQHLTPRGTLICNFVSREEFRNCGALCDSKLWSHYPNIFQLSTPLTENRVAIFLRQPADSVRWRQQLQSHPAINTRWLRYALRRVK